MVQSVSMLAAALFGASVCSAAMYPPVEWGSTGCSEGFDYCSDLEFCEDDDDSSVYGYRLPGTADCTFPAPLVRISAGESYEIRVCNLANDQTNIHSHGLHIPGSGNADDVTRVADPGMCLSVNWTTSAEHAGGTMWYHAHHHEVTNPQVTGGAFGMIIIEDDPSVIFPDDLSNEDREGIELWMANEEIVQMTYVRRKYFANGVPDGALNLEWAADVWYRLRISGVDPTPLTKPLDFDDECEVHPVTHDGTWRFLVPGEAHTEKSLHLGGASRIDVAIRCPQGVHKVTWDSNTVFEITAEAAKTEEAGTRALERATPFLANGGQWTPDRPAYLRDLRFTEPDETYSINFAGRAINNNQWDMDVPMHEMEWNTVQEWTLTGTGTHPFHMHLYHTQIVSPGGCGPHVEGQYYDVISSDDPCVVRFETADIGERCVIHCHRLAHEDAGMMVWVDVQGEGMPVTPNKYREPYPMPSDWGKRGSVQSL